MKANPSHSGAADPIPQVTNQEAALLTDLARLRARRAALDDMILELETRWKHVFRRHPRGEGCSEQTDEGIHCHAHA